MNKDGFEMNYDIQVLDNPTELKEKIFTLKEYAKLDKDGTDLDIKDPWGFNINTFRICAAEISVCIDKIIDELAK